MLARGHSFLHRHSLASQTHPNPALDTKRVQTTHPPKASFRMLWPGLSSQTPLLGPPRDVSPERGRPRLGPKQTLNGLDLESLQLLGMAAAEPEPTTEALDLSEIAPRIQVPERAVEEMSSGPGFFRLKVCNSPELFRECVFVLGEEKTLDPLGSILTPCTQITAPARQWQVPRGAGTPWERRVGGVRDPPLWTRVSFHTCPHQPRSWLLPAKGAYVVRSPTPDPDTLPGLVPRSRGSRPRRAVLTARLEPPPVSLRAAGLTETRSRSVAAMASCAPGGRVAGIAGAAAGMSRLRDALRPGGCG